ncbi:hypothetical protein M2650_14360 [Luteimonas sp. SX5]|uniref:DUF2974 domain-containing protein n=1 Tax=Luteimonas galliterrae TaxID=2940486 RepID=A0ABT0MNG7_9GAMM|nr:hypothetical protein [Luteimonas galliterrae]MCL1635809.1 hypothetical protein [Luteimonas galliterrae]
MSLLDGVNSSNANNDALMRYLMQPAQPQPAPQSYPRATANANGESFSDQVAGQQPQQQTDLQLAQMANDVYTVTGPDGTGTQSAAELEAAGWNRLQPDPSGGKFLVDSQGRQIPIDPAMLEDSSTGFRAGIYQNDQGQYVVAYAGTDPSEMPDIGADATQAFGLDTAQYNQAVALAKEAEVAFGDGNVVFTGHSLGGGLASAAALATGGAGVTFNAAGLSDDTLSDLGFSPNAARENVADSGQVRRYIVETDPLNTVQQDVPFLNGTPDAVGTELRVALPAGMTPFIDGHGGSGDGTSFVEALRTGTPYGPESEFLNIPGALGDIRENAAEYAINGVGNIVDGVVTTGQDVIDTVGGKVDDVRNEIDTNFAQGDYVEGVFNIGGDVVEGTFNVAGDLVSGGADFVSDQVSNLANYGGGTIRDLGDFVGLETPANFVAGVVEGGGEVIGDVVEFGGDAVEWTADALGTASEAVVDFTGDVAQGVTDFAGDVAEGVNSVMPWNW